MSKLALSFSLIIVGVLLVGIIVSSSIRYRSHKRGNRNSDKKNNNGRNSINNNSDNMTNFARLNSQASYNSLSKSLNNRSSPYVSSVHNNNDNDWTYGYFRGGDSLAGCSGCV